MNRKLSFMLLLALLWTTSCGNEKTAYPGTYEGEKNIAESPYKRYTLILYDKPYKNEIFFHFFDLLSRNNIEQFFFIPLCISDPQYKEKLALLTKDQDKLNLIALHLSPSQIKDYDMIQPYLEKKVYLFPPEEVLPIPNVLKVLPESNDEEWSYSASLYNLQNLDFLGRILVFLADGSVSKTKKKSQSSLNYIQGKTDKSYIINLSFPLEDQEKSTTKNVFKSLKKGEIPGIVVADKQFLNLNFIDKKEKTPLFSYYIFGLTNSFSDFQFTPPDKNAIDIYSFFTPIELRNISLAGRALKLPEDFKIYHLHFKIFDKPIIDPAKIKQLRLEYNKGTLSVNLPQTLMPLIYFIKVDKQKTQLSLLPNTVVYNLNKSSLKEKDFKNFNTSKQRIRVKVKETQSLKNPSPSS